MKILAVEAELFQVDGQTDRQTLSKFANAHINKKEMGDLL